MEKDEININIDYSLAMEEDILAIKDELEGENIHLPGHLEWVLKDIHHIIDEGYYTSSDFIQLQAREAQFAWVKQGVIANFIKKRALWEKEFKTWGAWCKAYLFRSHSSVAALIKSSSVWVRLLKAGFSDLPASQTQAYELRKLPDFELVETWQNIISEYPPEKRTAQLIRDYVIGTEFETKPRERIEGRGEALDELTRLATEKGCSRTAYLKNLIELERAVEAEKANIPIEATQRWEEDFEELLEEEDEKVESVAPQTAQALPRASAQIPFFGDLLNFLNERFDEMMSAFLPSIQDEIQEKTENESFVKKDEGLEQIARAVEFLIGQLRENATLNLISQEIADFLPGASKKSVIEKKIPTAIRMYTPCQGLRELRQYILANWEHYPIPACPWA